MVNETVKSENQRVTFSITEKCDGCGLCYAQFSNYFSELEDGKAKANTFTYMLTQKQSEVIEQLCPCKAIKTTIEKKLTKQDFVTELEKLKNFVVRYPERKDLKFVKSEYDISIPLASGERRYEYSSYEAAERAAGREIDSKMYSQIDIIILKIITEYRTKYLKPYYSKSSEDDSFFLKCNQKVSELLCRIRSILVNNNLANDIPDNFTEIDIFPQNDIYWKMLNKGEIMSDEMISTVRSEFRSNTYSAVEDYICYCDIDDMERADGTDWRGNTKYRDKYCYRDVHKAFKELASDLLNSCGYVNDKIEDRAMEIVNALIDEYNKLLQSALAPKLVYINSKIDKIPVGNSCVKLEKYENIIRRVGKNSDGFYINGEIINDPTVEEVFITASNNSQYFFDGTVIRKKYISNGIIHNDVIFSDRNFDYGHLCGYNGYILFEDFGNNFILYVYNTNNNSLQQIDTKIYRGFFKNDYFIYVTYYNIDNRYAPMTIKCCKIDGSDKRTICTPSGGVVFIKEITDTQIKYNTLQDSNVKTVNWNGSNGTGIGSVFRFKF